MITQETVLVLGAGASSPIGFPTGQVLLDIICRNLEMNFQTLDSHTPKIDASRYTDVNEGIKIAEDFYNAMQRPKYKNELVNILIDLGYSEDFIRNFRTSLKYAQVNSVDSFLEFGIKYIEIGKICISYILSKYEDPTFIDRDCNWYKYLWSKLIVPFEQFQNNKLSIVTFNYDRSIEFYLINAMKHLYDRGESECFDKLQKIPIIHLHGKLGNLPWENEDHNEFRNINFESTALKKISHSIKIIHENIDTTDEFQQAYEIMNKAKRIYFLGFGYGETNMKRLRISDIDVNGKEIMGTTWDLTMKQIDEIREFSGGKIVLPPGQDCRVLFLNHATLS